MGTNGDLTGTQHVQIVYRLFRTSLEEEQLYNKSNDNTWMSGD